MIAGTSFIALFILGQNALDLPRVQCYHNAPTCVTLTFAHSWSDHGLFLLSAAVTGQVALEQFTRELAVREGDGVTFQCSMSGERMSSYYMSW